MHREALMALIEAWSARSAEVRVVRANRNRKFVDLYGGFSVKWFFGLLPVPCLEVC